MRNTVVIENIEEMRSQQGIEDVELRKKIRGLAIGDSVRLTFLPGGGEFTGETLMVKITSIRGYNFRGKLATKPAFTGPSKLHLGSPIIFTTAHIHSLVKGETKR